MKYFSIRELSSSITAKNKGIDNTPSTEAEANLIKLVDNLLDPLREFYGKPIKVTSGYRCPKLNTAIGGAKNSQHSTGEAADITSLSDSFEDNKELFDAVLKSGLNFDQLIWEFGNSKGPDWVHVSYKSVAANRKQILIAKKISGKTVYEIYK